jgi:erythromycin esterase
VYNVEMQLAPDLATSVATRDQAMAESVAWLLERHGARSRLLLAAHNGHIAVQDGFLGHFLRDRWGRGYRAVCLVFDRGRFRATEYAFGRGGTHRAFEVGPTLEGGLGNALARAGTSIGIVDLRGLPAEGPARDWFRYGRAAWSIGAGFFPRFAPAFLMPVVAPEAYDALVFGERITPTTALP